MENEKNNQKSFRVGPITAEECEGLKQAVEAAGLYLIENNEEFETCIERCLKGNSHNDSFEYICGGNYNVDMVKSFVLTEFELIRSSGIIYADSKDLNAIAVWLPAEAKNVNIRAFVRSAIGTFREYGNFTAFLNIIRYQRATKAMRRNQTNGNDWYLSLYQCGLGNYDAQMFYKMFKPVVDYAWKSNRACYMECANEAGVPPCRSVGFHIIDQTAIPKSNIKVYAMMV